MDVLVFKTSVTRSHHIPPLRLGLDAVGRWSFDLDDCDHILRVETGIGQAAQIQAQPGIRVAGRPAGGHELIGPGYVQEPASAQLQ
ncbi:MAG: hypothetical protein JWP58_3833 [Hymenobacter sp.]|nr:hypothetical protein [Hymenobacter sp.]